MLTNPIFLVISAVVLTAFVVLFLKGRAPSSSELEADDSVGVIDEGVEPPSTAEPSAPTTPPTTFDRFFKGLSKTRGALGESLSAVFGKGAVDEALYTGLEEALISSDVGVKTSMALIERLRERAKTEGLQDGEALRQALGEEIKSLLKTHDAELRPAPDGEPHVILVVGVNGSGKTTTIGKLAARFKAEGKSVLLGAGDTFRAGAIEQLKVWATRTEVDVVAHEEGGDPSAVLFDSLKAAKARNHDVVICDTAGRLQSKKPLMDELGKVTRVVDKAQPGAPHEVLLVLDGTTGQNALSQGRIFNEVTGLTGVVVTKLDGTARGGVVLGIVQELGVPVKFIGIGEQVDDLRPFDPDAFADALLA